MEGLEVEGVGALDVGDEERARPVALLDVDGEPEVHVVVAHDVRLPVDDLERRVHRRHPRQRLEHGEGDEVREADLGATGPREVVVQDLPVDLEQLGGDGPNRGGRRDRQRGLHVLDDARRRPPDRDGPVAVSACGGAARALAAEPPREHALAAEPTGERRSRRGRLLGRPALVEELAPSLGHGGRVLDVAGVQVLDQAGVGAQILELAFCHRSSRGDAALTSPAAPSWLSDAPARRPGRPSRATGVRSAAGRTSSRTGARGGHRGLPRSRRDTR